MAGAPTGAHREGLRTMLYHRDARTGEHLVVHNGRERRFPTRAEALTAARELMSEDPNPSSDEAR